MFFVWQKKQQWRGNYYWLFSTIEDTSASEETETDGKRCNLSRRNYTNHF